MVIRFTVNQSYYFALNLKSFTKFINSFRIIIGILKSIFIPYSMSQIYNPNYPYIYFSINSWGEVFVLE
nr:MAG TPA: hypothetical protein [Caudoviricetes sp.]